MDQGIVHFIGTMSRESTMDKMSVEEKKIARVSPCFLHLEILKVSFWATCNSGEVVISVVAIFIVVVIVVADLVLKEEGAMQKVKSGNGKQKMT
jgi:hypothetical protein